MLRYSISKQLYRTQQICRAEYVNSKQKKGGISFPVQRAEICAIRLIGRSLILIATARLHLLLHESQALPLLRLDALPSQPDRHLLPHLAVLVQDPDVRTPSHGLDPELLGDGACGVAFCDDGAGFGA